jgi:hypothetical protein
MIRFVRSVGDKSSLAARSQHKVVVYGNGLSRRDNERLFGEGGQCNRLFPGEPVTPGSAAINGSRSSTSPVSAASLTGGRTNPISSWPFFNVSIWGPTAHRLQLHVHVIVSAVQQAHGLGRVHMVHAIADPHAQLHRVPAARATRHHCCAIAPREDVTCLFEEDPACLGELDTPFRTPEQGCLQFRLDGLSIRFERCSFLGP